MVISSSTTDPINVCLPHKLTDFDWFITIYTFNSCYTAIVQQYFIHSCFQKIKSRINNSCYFTTQHNKTPNKEKNLNCFQVWDQKLGSCKHSEDFCTETQYSPVLQNICASDEMVVITFESEKQDVYQRNLRIRSWLSYIFIFYLLHRNYERTCWPYLESKNHLVCPQRRWKIWWTF